MTIIVFLVDNTPSMGQRCSSGQNFLDLAKGSVETFLKFRSRDPAARGVDRYMLLTFDEIPKNVKAGWKESHVIFTQELKNLRTTGSSSIGQALGNSLHLLNINRIQSGIDNFAYGRYPSYLEPAVILLITDGSHLSPKNTSLTSELDISRLSLPGCELYSEPHRWDQRIFTVVLRIPGGQIGKSEHNPISNHIPNDIESVENLCEATGGRSYCVTSEKMLNICMENLVLKVQTGVMVMVEKLSNDSGPPSAMFDEEKNLKTENKQLMNHDHIIENGFVQPLPSSQQQQQQQKNAESAPRPSSPFLTTAPSLAATVCPPPLLNSPAFLVNQSGDVDYRRKTPTTTMRTSSSSPPPSLSSLTQQMFVPSINCNKKMETLPNTSLQFSRNNTNVGVVPNVRTGTPPPVAVACVVEKNFNGYTNSGSNTKSSLSSSSSSVVGQKPTTTTSLVGDFTKKKQQASGVIWRFCRTMLLVPRAPGRGLMPSHWPLPEPYYPDSLAVSLPPRNAQPRLAFKADPSELIPLLSDLPFDEYKLDPCQVTQWILEHGSNNLCFYSNNYCWPVYAPDSARTPGLGHPFGFLKICQDLKTVSLVVLPYNYQVLIQLLDEFKTNLKFKPNGLWRAKFDKYLRSVPPYYLGQLKKVLSKPPYNGLIEMPNVQHFLSFNVLSNIAKMKQKGREELDKCCQQVLNNLQSQAQQQTQFGYSGLRMASLSLNTQKSPCLKLCEGDNNFVTLDSNIKNRKELSSSKIDVSDFVNFRIYVALKSQSHLKSLAMDTKADLSTNWIEELDSKLSSQKSSQQMFKNPFDIPRNKLLSQLQKMRLNLQQISDRKSLPVLAGGCPGTRLKVQDADQLHSLPVCQMGNYQDYLKAMPPPLRPLETQPVRIHAFGNPFKVDKRMLVDEADLDIGVVASTSSGASSSVHNNNHNSIPKISKKPTVIDQFSSSKTLSHSVALKPHRRKPGPLPKNFSYKRFRKSSLGSLASMSPTRSELESISDLDSDTSSIAGDLKQTIQEECTEILLDGGDSHSVEENRRFSIDEHPTPVTERLNDSKLDSHANPCLPSKFSSFSEPFLSRLPTISGGKEEPQTNCSNKISKPTSKYHGVFRPETFFDVKTKLAKLIRQPKYNLLSIKKIFDELPCDVAKCLKNFALSEAGRFKRFKLAEEIRRHQIVPQ